MLADQIDAPSSHAADPMAAATAHRERPSPPATLASARSRQAVAGLRRPRSKAAGDPALLQMIARSGKIVSPTGDIWELRVMKDG
jgi:hypothetical protein